MTGAFAGTYSDLRFVKSRKVAQVVIEMPIEDANRFLVAFGAPDPGREVWCAIARLNNAPEPDNAIQLEKPRRQWDSLRPSARAAMLCNETAFQAYIKVQDAEQAAEKVRRHCGIESRRELDADETKRMKFEMVERDFQRWREEKHF
jgi:hypothetical protein